MSPVHNRMGLFVYQSNHVLWLNQKERILSCAGNVIWGSLIFLSSSCSFCPVLNASNDPDARNGWLLHWIPFETCEFILGRVRNDEAKTRLTDVNVDRKSDDQLGPGTIDDVMAKIGARREADGLHEWAISVDPKIDQSLSIRSDNRRSAISGRIWMDNQGIFKQESNMIRDNIFILGLNELTWTLFRASAIDSCLMA